MFINIPGIYFKKFQVFFGGRKRLVMEASDSKFWSGLDQHQPIIKINTFFRDACAIPIAKVKIPRSGLRIPTSQEE